MAISAHWYVPATLVTANEHPRTIHDFGGFPRELHAVQYPAPGDLGLAARVTELLAPFDAIGDERWGLDHGTWSVLVHVYPNADVPIVQLSIDETLEPGLHFEIGTLLRPLRDDGVMIVASGNIVHNLEAFAWGRHSVEAFDWARRFESKARELLTSRTFEPLIDYESLGEDAQLSVPTPGSLSPAALRDGRVRRGRPHAFQSKGSMEVRSRCSPYSGTSVLARLYSARMPSSARSSVNIYWLPLSLQEAALLAIAIPSAAPGAPRAR